MMTCILRTRDGNSYSLRDYASRVQETVNAARGGGKLIPLERDRIPTGQMVWIDPDEVIAIKDDR
jgi:hypothetical protein